MTKLAQNWPVLRQIAYGLTAVVLGASTLTGWLTADEAAQWNEHVDTLLGTVVALVAGLFVDRTSKAQEDKIVEAVQAGFDRVHTTATAVVEQTAPIVADYLGDALAEADRLLTPPRRP